MRNSRDRSVTEVIIQLSPWHSWIQSFFFSIIIRRKLSAEIHSVWSQSNGPLICLEDRKLSSSLDLQTLGNLLLKKQKSHQVIVPDKTIKYASLPSFLEITNQEFIFYLLCFGTNGIIKLSREFSQGNLFRSKF